jgi:hypothetical protein
MKVSQKPLLNMLRLPDPDPGHRKWDDYNFALIFTLQINKSYRYIMETTTPRMY